MQVTLSDGRLTLGAKQPTACALGISNICGSNNSRFAGYALAANSGGLATLIHVINGCFKVIRMQHNHWRKTKNLLLQKTL
jgi:hypothetical protein